MSDIVIFLQHDDMGLKHLHLLINLFLISFISDSAHSLPILLHHLQVK